MEYRDITSIEPGSKLAMSVFNSDCTLLLSANSTITQNHINKLIKHGFEGLYILNGNEDRYNDLLSDKTRMDAMRNLKHINIDACLYIANTITNTILNNPNVQYELLTICSYDTKTYMHCINVAILSTMIGVDMRLSNNDLYKLSQAALLHDIGKSCIDETIINKTDTLTNEEYNEVKKHSLYGYNMLRHNNMISESTYYGVLYHHENEDGTGYPFGLSGDDIPLFAKIIHVADVYDALVSKRSYKDSLNPADALEYLMGNTYKFNIDVVKSLIHCVALYPIGSTVELSDGQICTIYRNHSGYPQRPIVKSKNGTIIDLMSVLNLTIVNIIKQNTANKK